MTLPAPVDVVIATPGHSATMAYVKSLVLTCAALDERGISYAFSSEYSSFVPTARELTALGSSSGGLDFQTISVLGSRDYKKIFWIDSDIEWEPEDFLRLYDSDKKVVSGLYVLDETGRVAVGFANEQGQPVRVNKVEFLLHTEEVEVLSVGFGFVCVSKGVFEKMDRPWFGVEKIEIEGRNWNVGEDYSWCAGAIRAGFKIFVDPLVKVNHHKSTVYRV